MSSEFVKERNEALFPLDEHKIRAFSKKYNCMMSDDPIVFWASVYKSVLAIKNCPADVRAKAESWLDDHGFRRTIDYVEDRSEEETERIERHTFEHVTFPCAFYDWGQKMINNVVDGSRGYLADLYSHVEYADKAIRPYKPKHFNVLPRRYEAEDGAKMIVRIDLPKPANVLECRRIYLCRSEGTGKLMYFTSELSMEGTNYLCAWTKNHAHMLLRMGSVDNEFDTVAQLFGELADYEPVPQAV